MAGNVPPSGERLIADRFRRVWAIAQAIADEPGMTRFDLAGCFNVSERQTQADLNIIRERMRLPMVRTGGYRFVDEGGTTSASGLDFADVLTLVAVMRRAKREIGIPVDRLATLVSKSAQFAPPHLRPLAALLLARPETDPISHLAELTMMGGSARLIGSPAVVITPELLFPYDGRWYAMGEGRENGHARDRVICLDGVTAVDPVVIETRPTIVVRRAS